MSIKVITFDLDNTLWDVEPVLVKAEAAQYQWLLEHCPRLPRRFSKREMRDRRLAFWRENPQLGHQISEVRIQSTRELLLACRYSAEEAETAAREAFQAFLQVRQQVQPYPEAPQIVEQLAERYTLGALSNGNADIFRVDLGRHFSFAYNAEHIDAGKPLPDLFRAALNHTGARATELVHVGDSPQHDVAGAHAAGVYAVWLNRDGVAWTGDEPANEDIRSLRQLPRAIDRIEELGRR